MKNTRKDKIIQELRCEITEKATWINDKNSVKDIANKGLYLFREKTNGEIIYVGVGGTNNRNLQFRVNQYYTPGDKGAKFFKCKVMDINADTTEEKWNVYKSTYQSTWKETMNRFQVGIIPLEGYSKHELFMEEALTIGVFKPKYNF